MGRPKRTYNETTGKWEVQKLWDSQRDGKYWKKGNADNNFMDIEVDSSGVPIYDAQGNEQGAETPGSATATSTQGTNQSILTGGVPPLEPKGEPKLGDADFLPNTTTAVAIGQSSQDGTTGTPSTVPPKKNDDRDTDGDGVVSPQEREDAWALNPKNPNSVNHPDYVAPEAEPEQNPHWSDTSQVGGGGHENAPGTTPVPSIITGGDSGTDDDSGATPTYTPKDPENPQGVDEPVGPVNYVPSTGIPLTDPWVDPNQDPNQPLSNPLLQSSNSSSAAGGYGKKRGREISRKHMNLTGSSRRSLLTGV
jgi:hypothetical protein